MRSFPTAFLATTFTILAAAAPNPQSFQESTCTEVNIWQPEIYTVFPDYPKHVYAKNNNRTLYLTQEGQGKDPRLAVLVWKDVPKTETCKVGFLQPAQGTNFGYFGDAIFDMYQLKLGRKSFLEAVDDTPNWENVGELAGIHLASQHSEAKDGHYIGSNNFAGWPDRPDAEGLNSTGDGGALSTCEGEVAVFMRFKHADEAMVVLQQDAGLEYGMYLKRKFDC